MRQQPYRRDRFPMLLLLAGIIPGWMYCSNDYAQDAIAPPAAHRVYAHLLNPREYPDDARRHVRPPDWDTFGNRTRFTSLRGLAVQDGQIVGYREEIDRYVRRHDLGEILWPSYPVVFASNLGDLADEIKRRGLFLFDIWGYVPGSGPGGYWQQFKPPAGVFDLLESKLGDHWLGMDVGEQDGRYIGGYASQMEPASASRFEQYLNFQHHFERMCDDLGNRMSTLVSLNYGHYFLKEGLYALIGAETAQALPNGQVYYSFIRGAGKQYGVPWFGNASVYNRWGFKSYGPPGPDHGPTMGTSLSLMKRLLYSHILYNSVFVGFESGWLDGDKLTPIGRIQQSARQWVRQNGQPGVMITPIALMLDFAAGWTFPRHLYTRHVYRVWGNLPYDSGDYLTDGVLDMLYPGYQDSSYYHDESGFLSPTPYGDAADCLLSDAPVWLLSRYPVLVIAGELSGGSEIRDKLLAYVEGGGHLLITAGSLARLPDGVGGVRVIGPGRRFPAGAVVQFADSSPAEEHAFELRSLDTPRAAHVTASCGGVPAVMELSLGKGRVTVFASPFGLSADPATNGPITNEVDKPLVRPYPLLAHVRRVLDEVFRGQSLFEAGEGLSLITCRKSPGRYTLGVCNNSWQQKPFKLTSHCGLIRSVRELVMDQSEKEAAGRVPNGMEEVQPGASGDETIAGGDIRVFDVQVDDENVEEISRVSPPRRPQGRVLPLPGIDPIQRQVLARPTFFEHFDGVIVDWKYLREREADAVRREAGWIARQRLHVFVDVSSGINLYPDLRLIDNVIEDYEASLAAIDDVLAKMRILGSQNLLLSLHRYPENNFTNEQTEASLEKTLRRICADAAAYQVTVFLRMSAGKPPWSLAAAVRLADRVGAANLRLAPSTALLISAGMASGRAAEVLGDHVGLWLVSAPEPDIAGSLWNVHGRIATCGQASVITELLKMAPDKPVVLDAIYENQDDEYLDAVALERLAPFRPPPVSQTGP